MELPTQSPLLVDVLKDAFDNAERKRAIDLQESRHKMASLWGGSILSMATHRLYSLRQLHKACTDNRALPGQRSICDSGGLPFSIDCITSTPDTSEDKSTQLQS
jgi:hypothetical protein